MHVRTNITTTTELSEIYYEINLIILHKKLSEIKNLVHKLIKIKRHMVARKKYSAK